MTDKVKEIQIDEAGFLTPGKAITISTMSLFIWILTGIIYKMMTFVASHINYQAVCFFTSLLLSCICGFYLVKKILKDASLSTKVILGFANVILLYTSANGIQTGYCFISKPTSSEMQQSSLIPFLIARPWLPDQLTTSENESLKEENKNLKEQLSSIPDPSGYVKTIQDLTTKNQELSQQLTTTITDDRTKYDALVNQMNAGNPDDKATISRLQNIVDQYTSLNNSLITLQNLRQNPCIVNGEAVAYRYLNDLCKGDQNIVNEYKTIMASLKPVQ